MATVVPFGNITPVDSVDAEKIGSATIVITPGNDIQRSNFGTNSFRIENTGDKRIAAIYFDITNALFPDTVFDPQGIAGDTVARGLDFSDTGSSGANEPASNKNDPNVVEPFFGIGGSAGYEGMLLTFDANVDGGYEPGELIRFGVDTDANSIVGLPQNPIDINGNDPRVDTWDIGGVSGAELINSEVHVLFTDGTTAIGELMGDGSQSGAVAVASQNSPNKTATLTVNGISEGGTGTYSQNNSQVTISGQAGDTARVVLVKGFIQPFDYIAPGGNPVSLAELFDGEEFRANNAVEFQTVDILLDGSEQDITALFDFTADNLPAFTGNDQLPLGFVTSIIDANELPLGTVTEPIYLEYSETTLPTLSINDVTVNESNLNAVFTVTLSEVPSSQVTVDFATANNTAKAGSDYTAQVGTVTFSAGKTSQIITIPIAAGDGVDGSNETFTVQLRNATGANLADAFGIGTIVDSDTSVPNPPGIADSGVNRVGDRQNDKLVGTNLNDVLTGKGGNDKLLGNNGDDILRGGRGNDRLRGGIGNDTLIGNGGNDRLIAGAGTDILDGRRGNDLLTFGSGQDTAIFRRRDGQNRIKRFDVDEDVLQFRGARSRRDLDIQETQRGVLITFEQATIAINGINDSSLRRRNFMF